MMMKPGHLLPASVETEEFTMIEKNAMTTEVTKDALEKRAQATEKKGMEKHGNERRAQQSDHTRTQSSARR